MNAAHVAFLTLIESPGIQVSVAFLICLAKSELENHPFLAAAWQLARIVFPFVVAPVAANV